MGFVKRMNQNLVTIDHNNNGDTSSGATDNMIPDVNYDDSQHLATIALQNEDLNNDQQMVDLQEALATVGRQKKIVTRRNAEPWDLVTPLHTPKKKKNSERRYPYKARYRTGLVNRRSEVSNRRSINVDTLRGLDDAVFTIDDDHPLASDYVSTQNRPPVRVSSTHGNKSNYNGVVKNCSVRLNGVLDDWVTSSIKK